MTLPTLYQRAELYDLEFGPYRADLPFYGAVLRHTGGPWLEAGCGTGRLPFLLDNPLPYVGVDPAPAMLERFRARARARGMFPVLVRASLPDLPFAPGAFGVCTLAYNLVQHLGTADVLTAALSACARVARHVALDVFMPPLPGTERWDDSFDAGEPRRTATGQPVRVQERTRFHADTRVQETALRMVDAEGAVLDQAVFTRRTWSAEELLAAVAAAGMTVRWAWGDVFGEPHGPRSPRLMLLCDAPR